MTKTAFGSLLRRLREDARISLGDLARHLQVSTPYLSDVERGNKKPLSGENIREAATLLGIDPTALLKAAIADRHALEIDLSGARPRTIEVGAALMRGFSELDDAELDAISEVLGRRRRDE